MGSCCGASLGSAGSAADLRDKALIEAFARSQRRMHPEAVNER